jgi:hypothetical protein
MRSYCRRQAVGFRDGVSEAMWRGWASWIRARLLSRAAIRSSSYSGLMLLADALPDDR